MRTWRVWAAVVAVPLLGGCGTTSNLAGPTAEGRPYGGVRGDLAFFDLAARDDTCISWAFAPLVALDLPLSAVGDTVTLPYTLFVNSDLFRHEFVYTPTDEFLAELNSAPRFPSSSGDR